MAVNDDLNMSVAVANSLLTNAYLSERQLENAYRHYKTLAEILTVSGPKFSDARLQAVEMGNRALEKLRQERARVKAEEERDRNDDGLDVIR